MLDSNTWNHSIVSNLFVLKIVTSSDKCLLKIVIISYLKPYHCVQIICVGKEYLKLYNSVLTNE